MNVLVAYHVQCWHEVWAVTRHKDMDLGFGNIDLYFKSTFDVHWSIFFYMVGLQNEFFYKDDIIHEKGGIEHILGFASHATIVIRCCTLKYSMVSL